MEVKRLKTAFGEVEYQKTNSDVEKVINVTIGRYYKAQFEYIEDAFKFVELGISGGADPADFKIYITFKKKGEDDDAAEN